MFSREAESRRRALRAEIAVKRILPPAHSMPELVSTMEPLESRQIIFAQFSEYPQIIPSPCL